MSSPRIIDSHEVYYVGEPSTSKLSYKSKTNQIQKYDEIIKVHSASNPFIDPEFPTNNDSIGKLEFDVARGKDAGPNKDTWDGTYKWKRIKDIIQDLTQGRATTTFREPSPQNEHEKYSRHDIIQGVIGDCWFVSTLAELTRHKKLFEWVVPDDNLANNDSGAFHFRIQHDGIWIDVVVDDFIPYMEVDNGPEKPKGVNFVGLNPAINETKSGSAGPSVKTWMLLVEKAYAKLNTNYAMLETNSPHNAMVDLMGGFGYSEILIPAFTSNPEFTARIWEDMKKYYAAGDNLIGFVTPENALLKPIGIAQLHVYTLTGITTLELSNGKSVNLVRLRNPWGHFEWKGEWNDSSEMWKLVSDEKKQQLGLNAKDDGEFWIEYSNALKIFNSIGFGLGIELERSQVGQRATDLRSLTFHGRWRVANGTAGGKVDLANNPQYILEVGNPASPFDCDLFISLQQKTSLRSTFGLEFGFQLYWVSDPTYTKYKQIENEAYDEFSGLRHRFGPDFFNSDENSLVKSAGSWKFHADEITTAKWGRDVAGNFRVRPGTYLIVPTTGIENTEADFILRFWYESYHALGIITEIEYAEGILPE